MDHAALAWENASGSAPRPGAADEHAMYKTRYAPSPTGAMHLGHARTALLAWLRARSLGGRIVMRMEDLDPPRVRPGSADAILRDHAWLGLDWDEGPVYQSARTGAYEEALAQLARGGRIYPCTCTRKEIEAALSSAPHVGDPGGELHDSPERDDQRDPSVPQSSHSQHNERRDCEQNRQRRCVEDRPGKRDGISIANRHAQQRTESPDGQWASRQQPEPGH